MAHPSTRLLTLLELLQARGRMRGPELARRLEVSPRTVRRYVAMLQEMGIPVEGTRGRYGDYRLRPGYKLPPLMFDDDEALAVTAGVLLVRGAGGLVDAAVAERTLAKLERVLPERLREGVAALQETLVLDVQPGQRLPGGEQLATVGRGARGRRRVDLRYRGERGTATEREVDPYGLVQRAGRWYAVGWCHLRRDMRIFRIDRIERARLLDATFEPPAGFDAGAWVDRELALAPMAHRAAVLLETGLAEARLELYPNFVTLEPVDGDEGGGEGGVVMRCTTDSLAWLARVLASLPFGWRVLEPLELEDALRAHAAAITARLGGRSGDGRERA